MELLNIVRKEYPAEVVTGTKSAAEVSANGLQTIAYAVEAEVVTPSNVVVPSADIDFATDTFEEVGHGLFTGLAVTLTTSGALPDPLQTTTTYYVIVLDEDNFQLAASLADALAGTPITLTDAGTGDQTVVVTAIAGASVALEKSIDGVIWFPEGSASNITVTANFLLSKVDPELAYYRIAQAITSGAVRMTVKVLGKGLV